VQHCVNAIGQRVQVQGVTDDIDQLRENECMLAMQVTYFMLTSDTISHLFFGETDDTRIVPLDKIRYGCLCIS